jgi:hypothetical protein
MPNVLDTHMGEVAWPTKPTGGQTVQPPWALAQCWVIVVYYGLRSIVVLVHRYDQLMIGLPWMESTCHH